MLENDSNTNTPKHKEAKKSNVLVFSEDPRVQEWVESKLQADDPCRAYFFASQELASEAIGTQHLEVDVFLIDLDSAEAAPKALVELFKSHYPGTPYCVFTKDPTVEKSVDALRRGAFDFFSKPLDRKVFFRIVEKATEFSELKKENLRLKDVINAHHRVSKTLIAESPAMKKVASLIERSAPSDASILITGESGVGKEVVAKEIHKLSARKDETFIAVNCAALPENLIESELFGHKKGAFTGAERSHDGLIRAAQGGTLFLDEIGELSLEMQSKILRFLQDSIVRPVGSTNSHPVDVRVLAATNRDLQEAIHAGKFREDLFFRLNVIPIEIRPLRERPEDVAALLALYLKEFSAKNNPQVKRYSPEAYEDLTHYSWPGNVRELQNTVERAVVLTQTESIPSKNLFLSDPNAEQNPERQTDKDDFNHAFRYYANELPTLEEIEHAYIRYVLEKENKSKEEIAQILGINRKTLYRKIKAMQNSTKS